MKVLLSVARFFYTLRAVCCHYLAYVRRSVRNAVYAKEGFGPVPGDDFVSVKWMQELLVKNGLIDSQTTLVKAELARLDENRGLAAVTGKIVLTYERDASSKKTPPSSLFMKRSTNSVYYRREVYAAGHIREALFYGSSLTDVIPVGGIPKAYYTYSSSFLSEYTVIMEDLTTRNAIPVNLIFGNQIWGIPKPPNRQLDVVEVLAGMYSQIAGIHAAYWKDKSLFQKPWLKGTQWYQGRGRLDWELGIQRGFNSWEHAKRKIAEGKAQYKFSPKFVKLVDESFQATSWEAFQESLKDPAQPWTLCHGDFHAGNMVLIDDGKSKNGIVAMCDWSEVGIWEPTSELAQTIISDVKPNIFGAHCRDLVLGYWRRLIELGVSKEEYPFEQCWTSYCRGGIQRWIWFFSIMPGFPVPDSLIQYFHDQLSAFIEFFGTDPYYPLNYVVAIV